MGYIKHHTIVVTTWDTPNIQKARDMACECGCLVSEVVVSKDNGYMTFFVAPDGSKEGWDPSYAGDDSRNAFVRWLESQRYDDRSSPYEWFEASYGSDDRKATIERQEWPR